MDRFSKIVLVLVFCVSPFVFQMYSVGQAADHCKSWQSLSAFKCVFFSSSTKPATLTITVKCISNYYGDGWESARYQGEHALMIPDQASIKKCIFYTYDTEKWIQAIFAFLVGRLNRFRSKGG